MRTHFECVLVGDKPESLLAAGHEALERIRATERHLSIFNADSWLSRLNAHAGGQAIAVPHELLQILRLCRELHQASDGAFDPTVGAQLDHAGLRDTPAAWASADKAAAADFSAVQFDGNRVRLSHPGLRIDLGGIAKGWALDRARETLVDAGVQHALLHAGTSSICAWGDDPHIVAAGGWRVEVEDQLCVRLNDASLSVSATLPNTRKSEAHLVDPATGQPIRSQSTSVVLAQHAAVADAWSTALLARDPQPFHWKYIP